jgi:hypothetical protein
MGGCQRRCHREINAPLPVQIPAAAAEVVSDDDRHEKRRVGNVDLATTLAHGIERLAAARALRRGRPDRDFTFDAGESGQVLPPHP